MTSDYCHTMYARSLDDTIAIAQANPHASSSRSAFLSSESETRVVRSSFTGASRTTSPLAASRNAKSSWPLHIIATLLLLALLPTSTLAIFDSGSPSDTQESGSNLRRTSQSVFGAPLPSNDRSLVPASGPPVSLPPGCRRTSDLLGEVCQNPWAAMQGNSARMKAELVICSVDDVEPLLEGNRQKRERVYAISGTITFPEELDGQPSASFGYPKQPLLGSEVSSEDSERTSHHEKEGVEGIGDGFWRQVNGHQEWQPSEPDSPPEAANAASASQSSASSTSSAGAQPHPPNPPPHEHQAYTDWTASIGGESADTFLSFAEWKERHLAAEKEREREEHERARAAKKGKSEKSKADADSAAASSHATMVASGDTVNHETRNTTQSDGATPSDKALLDPHAPTADKTLAGDALVVPSQDTPGSTEQATTYDSIPALSDGAEYLATLKHRWNFASTDCAAGIHRANPSAKFASAILSEKKDRYMLSPCPSRGGRGEGQFVIVELCDEISIDTVVLANYEFFSRVFKRFRISVTRNLQGKADDWHEIGTFRARNARGPQVFKTPQPRSDARFFRYLRIDFLEHYGSEFYCPLSLLRVYGLTQMEDYVREEEELRKAKELERRRLEEGEPEGEGDAKGGTETHQAYDAAEVFAPIADAGKVGEGIEESKGSVAISPTSGSTTSAEQASSRHTAIVTEDLSAIPTTLHSVVPGQEARTSSAAQKPLATSSVFSASSSETPDARSSVSSQSLPPEAPTTMTHQNGRSGVERSSGHHPLIAPSEPGLNGSLETPTVDPNFALQRETMDSTHHYHFPDQPGLNLTLPVSNTSQASVQDRQPSQSPFPTSVATTTAHTPPPTHVQPVTQVPPSVSIAQAPATVLPATGGSEIAREPSPVNVSSNIVTFSMNSTASGNMTRHPIVASTASQASSLQSQDMPEAVTRAESGNKSSASLANSSVSKNGTSVSSSTSSASATSSDTAHRTAGGGGGGGGGGAESIYRTITKRLNALEANATLSLQYMEHSSGQLREVFARMERRAEERMGEMLRVLNESNWKQIEALKRRQHVDLQRAVFEFDLHRQQVDVERTAVLEQVHLLSKEIVSEKRVGVVQLILLLCLFVFMALTRSSRASDSSSPLLRSNLSLPRALRSPRSRSQSANSTATAIPTVEPTKASEIVSGSRPRGNSVASTINSQLPERSTLLYNSAASRTPKGATSLARFRRAPSTGGKSRAGLLLAGIPTVHGSPRHLASSGRKPHETNSTEKAREKARADFDHGPDSRERNESYTGTLRSYLEYQLSSPNGKRSSGSLSGSGSGSVGMQLPDSRSTDDLRAFLKTPPSEHDGRGRWGDDHRRQASSPLYADEPPSLYQRRESTALDDGNTTESVSSWTDRSDSESDAGHQERSRLAGSDAGDDEDESRAALQRSDIDSPLARPALGMVRSDTIRHPPPPTRRPPVDLASLEIPDKISNDDAGYERDEDGDAEHSVDDSLTVDQRTWKVRAPALPDAAKVQSPLPSNTDTGSPDDGGAPWQEVRSRRAGSIRLARSTNGRESPQHATTPERRSSLVSPTHSPTASVWSLNTPRTSSPTPNGSGTGSWGKLLRRGGGSTGKSTPTGPATPSTNGVGRHAPPYAALFRLQDPPQTQQNHLRQLSNELRPSSPLRPASPRFALHLRGNSPALTSPAHSNGSSPSPSPPPRSPAPTLTKRKGTRSSAL